MQNLKKMTNIRIMLVSFILLTTQIYAETHPVELTLLQTIDKQCTGNTVDSNELVGGDCIIYTITATNRRSRDIHHLEMTGLIPKHTQLIGNPELTQNGNTVFIKNTLIKTPENQTGKISTTIESLAPGDNHSVVLRYRVRVEH
jgi:hypothetical protein